MAALSALRQDYVIAFADQVQIHAIALSYVRLSPSGSGMTINQGAWFADVADSTDTSPLELSHSQGNQATQLRNYQRRRFKISVPSVNDRGSVAGSLEIENIDLAITDILARVEGRLEPIELTYRIYLEKFPNLPLLNPAPLFYLSNAVISGDRVRFKLVHPNLVNRSYPSRVYNVDEFPQLVGFNR